MKTRLLLLLLLMSFTSLLFAYGPQNVTTSGTVVVWPNKAVTYHLEGDTTVSTKSVATLIDAALAQWTGVTEASITMTKSSLGADVDNDNVCCYVYDSTICPDTALLTDGNNPVVVDEDGSIAARFFGTSGKFSTLGFAAMVSYSDTTALGSKGEAVFNAACLSGVEQSGCSTAGTGGGALSFSDDDFTSFVVHEIGHFLGLNHSQVNRTESKSGASFDGTLVTTMWPFFTVGNGGNFKTPEKDDKVGLALLYPATNFASTTGKVSGTVSASGSQFQCANVVVRNTTAAQSKTDALSFVSGSLHVAAATDGAYEILGLTAGQSYSVAVEPIDTTFTGASGIPPCDGGSHPSPSSKQFTAQTSSTVVSASAGSTATGVDFTVTPTSSNLSPEALVWDDENLLDGVPLLEEEEDPEILAAIDALELRTKSASSTCSAPGTVSSASSGCSLIPDPCSPPL